MRPKRIIWRLAVSLSLALCAGATMAWIRSHCAFDTIQLVMLDAESHYYGVAWDGGQMQVHWQHTSRSRYGPQRSGLYWVTYPSRSGMAAPVTFWTSLGFYRYSDRRNGSIIFIFPLWLPLALFSTLPAVACRNRIRHWRRLCRGLCPRCGYDLRASPGRCPECGHEPQSGAIRVRAVAAGPPIATTP